MRRRSRTRRHTSSDGVSLNLAAMLDMAFQLLTFFILTFRPVPTEGQLAVHLPPATKPAAPVEPNDVVPSDPPAQAGGANPFETLNLYVTASDRGDAREVRAGGRRIAGGRLDEPRVSALSRELGQLFAATSYERVQIIADSRLQYGELMKLVDVCTRQKLSDGSPLRKVSFLQSDDPAAANFERRGVEAIE